MLITLTVTAGPHKGRVFEFDRHDTFIVGRSERAHFRLPVKDRYFSRIHFLVEANPPYCRLLDLGSRNGTYINGTKITTADLKDGDRIKGGRTILSVRVEATPPPAAPPDPAKLLVAVAVPISEAPPTRAIPLVSIPSPPPASSDPGSLVPRPRRKPAAVVSPTGPLTPCTICGKPASRPAVPRSFLLCPACQQASNALAQTIPGYLLVRELGRGGMGVVYHAVREADGRTAALKTILPAAEPTPADIERFLREARILQDLEHPHIVAFRDIGEAGGVLWFAMDYINGTDAAKLLKENKGPLPIPRAVNLICQALEALEYAHARRYVHRDLKPANLLVTQHAGREIGKLADFGLARVYQESKLSGLTMTGMHAGTPAFMPPEQIMDFRNVGPAADQYSAAATLYNLLTDKYLFDGPMRVEVMLLNIMQEEPVAIRKRREEISEELAAIIHRTLAKEPGERFTDVKRLREALEQSSP